MGTSIFRWVGRTVIVLGAMTFLLAPAAAFAQTSPQDTPYPTVQPSTTSTTKDPCIGTGNVVTHVNGLSFCTTVDASSATSSSGSLAFTGANIALLVGLGLVIAAGGVVLVRLGRRPEATN